MSITLRPSEKLRRHWIAEATSDEPPVMACAEAADLDALERRYGITLPADFRDHLRLGVPDPCSPAGWATDWWTVDRIRPVAEEYNQAVHLLEAAINADRYLVFADYAIWCMAWAIACAEDVNHGRVMVINGVNDRFVADSFGEFVDRHIADVHTIL